MGPGGGAGSQRPLWHPTLAWGGICTWLWALVSRTHDTCRCRCPGRPQKGLELRERLDGDSYGCDQGVVGVGVKGGAAVLSWEVLQGRA